MKRPRRTSPRWRAVVQIAAAALVLGLVVPTSSAAAPERAWQPEGVSKLDRRLQEKFQTARGGQDFWVTFTAKADTSGAAGITDWVERGRFVVDRLKRAATSSQAATIADLDRSEVRFTSYWISNTIRVRQGSLSLATQLAARADVARVLAPAAVVQFEPVRTAAAPAADDGVEWGIHDTNADQVWNTLGITGKNIVVGSIDTGVDVHHPALLEKYRGYRGAGQALSNDYNWVDLQGTSTEPVDNHGHGTHTVGTMVGDDGTQHIGMAPGAKWIAANGCCPSDEALLKASQWMLAPTRIDGSDPDPAMRPHIINNSWGSQESTDAPFLEDLQQAWADAGIFGVFANGNNGPACRTSGTPGSRSLNYSVGAYSAPAADGTRSIAPFSSRGSGQDGDIKPNIAAPGDAIRSAKPGGGYVLMSGTSMAAPHVAGAIALLWSANPALVGQVGITRSLLDDTAVDNEDLQCGGTVFDNNVFGEGRLDALALVRANSARFGSVGGTVTDTGTGAPIAGAVVTVGDKGSAVTDRNGRYRLGVREGTYEVRATKYGYLPVEGTAVVATSDVTVDLEMELAPFVEVSGTVTDGSGHGWPLLAQVTFVGNELDPVMTDPRNGRYTLRVPAGTDTTMTATPVAIGYRPAQSRIRAVGQAMRVDLPAAVDLTACRAPGYRIGNYRNGFDGWTVVRDGWSMTGGRSGWSFRNPGHRMTPNGGQGAFAIADAAVTGQWLRTSLTSAPIPVTVDKPSLLLNQRLVPGPRDSARILVSLDNGRTWAAVWSRVGVGVNSPAAVTVPGARRGMSLRVRFDFASTGTGYWAIDDVVAGNAVCGAQPGALVIGRTLGAGGTPIIGARVFDAQRSTDYTVSVDADPGPDRTDSFYWFFLDRGERTLAAARSNLRASDRLTVPASGTLVHDLELTAGG